MPDAPDWSRREAKMFGEQQPKGDDPDDMPKLAARLFRTRDGRVWLEKMRRLKFDVSIGPEVTQAYMYYLEGQRQILRDIIHAIQRAEQAEENKQK